MTINFNNVYLKDVATIGCQNEKKGTFGNLYDRCYDDYYAKEKTFEQAEIKMISDSVPKIFWKYCIFFVNLLN